MHPIYGQKNIADFIGCGEDKLRECIADGLPIARIGQEYVSVDVDLIDYIRSQYGKWRSNPTNVEKSTGLDSPIPEAGELRDLLGQHQNVRPIKEQPKLSVVTKRKKQQEER